MTRRTVLELADLAVKASAYNSIFRRAENQARALQARTNERLTAHDAKLIRCTLCDKWLYLGRYDTLGQNIPAYRGSIIGHMRAYHRGQQEADRAALQAKWARGLHKLREA